MASTFFQTWVKYIPVIRILLKRSVKAEQKLEMNSTDFFRAAAGRKVNFPFSVSLYGGKLQGLQAATPVAADLIDALLDDEISNQFVKANHLEFSMNKNFELLIRNTTPSPPAGDISGEAAQTSNELHKTIDESSSTSEMT